VCCYCNKGADSESKINDKRRTLEGFACGQGSIDEGHRPLTGLAIAGVDVPKAVESQGQPFNGDTQRGATHRLTGSWSVPNSVRGSVCDEHVGVVRNQVPFCLAAIIGLIVGPALQVGKPWGAMEGDPLNTHRFIVQQQRVFEDCPVLSLPLLRREIVISPDAQNMFETLSGKPVVSTADIRVVHIPSITKVTAVNEHIASGQHKVFMHTMGVTDDHKPHGEKLSSQ